MAATHHEETHPPLDGPSSPAQVLLREPLVLHNRSYSWITERICGIIEKPQPKLWWMLFIPSVLLFSMMAYLFAYLISTGVGVWGQNHPVAWGWDITNFVFWIGIGHAGTLISAILFLTRQRWRTSVARAAEAMTIFAVMCAGLYPALHVGRVSTYFTVSVLFWYLGLIPDLGTIRDRCKPGIKKALYGLFALGWRGGNRQWNHYEMAYLLLAALSTPLVLSVHTIVSFDFATSVVPGWHATIFPPYFVAGAIFGGFAMVLTLMLPVREIYGLQDLLTWKHIDNMAKIILLTGTIVGYAYLSELFIAWYGGNKFELDAFMLRIKDGPYVWAYVAMMFCNVVSPQIFWFKKMRQNWFVVFLVCNFVNAGMWFERFVIIVTTLARDFVPGAWDMFHPTWVDIMTFVGSFGFFLMNFLLFLRFLPVIAIAEVKGILPQSDPHGRARDPRSITEQEIRGEPIPDGFSPAPAPASTHPIAA